MCKNGVTLAMSTFSRSCCEEKKEQGCRQHRPCRSEGRGALWGADGVLPLRSLEKAGRVDERGQGSRERRGEGREEFVFSFVGDLGLGQVLSSAIVLSFSRRWMRIRRSSRPFPAAMILHLYDITLKINEFRIGPYRWKWKWRLTSEVSWFG